MKNNQTKTIFNVVAAICLLIAAFQIYYVYTGLSATAANGGVSLSDNIPGVIAIYIQQCAPYFIYAFLSYGMGIVIEKTSLLKDVMSKCIVEAEEEITDEDLEALENLETEEE